MSALRPAIVIFLFLTLITGGVYPLVTTALGQWLFPTQANGSLIFENHELR
ncbi:potassium-transporting ATPase subunit C, partial [Kluyvera cryocrescens]